MTTLQTILAILTITTAISAAWLYAVKLILDRHQKHLDEKLKEIGDATSKTNERVSRVERDLAELRLEMSRDYVRKEDWVRFGTTISAKLDGLWLAIDQLKERFHGRAEGKDGDGAVVHPRRA